MTNSENAQGSSNGNNEPKPPEALSVGRYTERLWGYKDQVGSHSEMGRLYERDRADFWYARFKEATSNETPPRSKKRVDVPAGEVWWADGVLTDADFLLKLAKGLAVADPRADRLCRIADAMDRPALETGERRVEVAAAALLADVRRRYPGEALRCPFMIELDNALKADERRVSKFAGPP